jgi:hypothetical protein
MAIAIDGGSTNFVSTISASPSANRTVTVPDATFTVAAKDVAQTFTAAQTFGADVTLNAQSDLRFADSDSSNWVAFQAPATVSSNVTWTLPAADGTSNQALVTNGSGTLSFATAGSSLTGVTDSASPFETSLGTGAGGSSTGAYNTFIGFEAGNDNTTGVSNTAVGYLALSSNTTGANNTAVGTNAASKSTTATGITAVGYAALFDNTTGANNTAVGDTALVSNTTGSNNTAVGFQALEENTTGADNTAVGYQALDANTTGTNNVAMGSGALGANTTGASNTAVGYAAGDSITTGVNKTVIGNNADVGTPTGSHEIVLGSGIVGQGTDHFTFGSFGNLVYNQFTANATFTRSSDERLKTAIKDANIGLDFIKNVRPVSYKWKPSYEVPEELFMHYNQENQMDLDVVMHGFIAQEVKQALETTNSENCGVWVTERDGTQGVSREMFIVPLVKAVQELSAKVTALEAQLATTPATPPAEPNA